MPTTCIPKLILATVVLAGCSAGTPSTTDEGDSDNTVAGTAPPGAPAGVASASPAAAGDPAGAKGAVRLVVVGGLGAGTYEVRDVEVPCLTVGGSFTAAYGSPGVRDNSLNSLLFETRDARDASGRFRFSLMVMRQGAPSTYLIDNSRVPDVPASGSGTVTVEERGASATVRVKGRTANGVDLDLQADCSQLGRV